MTKSYCHSCLQPQADKERDIEATVSSLQSHVDRLTADLEEASIQVQVLSAKGHMYDELQAKADKLVSWGNAFQASVQRLPTHTACVLLLEQPLRVPMQADRVLACYKHTGLC